MRFGLNAVKDRHRMTPTGVLPTHWLVKQTKTVSLTLALTLANPPPLAPITKKKHFLGTVGMAPEATDPDLVESEVGSFEVGLLENLLHEKDIYFEVVTFRTPTLQGGALSKRLVGSRSLDPRSC